MERRPDRFTAVLDANVLVGSLTRNVLLHLGEAGFYRPRWSAKILREVKSALERQGKQDAYLDNLFAKMAIAFPEASVEDWEIYEPVATALPDKGDRHVLAAAIKCDAAVIVTENLKDFPIEALKPTAIQAVSADKFIADLADLDQASAAAAIERMRLGFRHPEYTWMKLIDRMDEIGLRESAAIFRTSNPGR